MEQAVALLKDHGLKATPQRIAIYNYLCGFRLFTRPILR